MFPCFLFFFFPFSFSFPIPVLFLFLSFRFPFLFLSLSFPFPFPLPFLFFPFPSFTLTFPFPFPRSCESFDQGAKPALRRTIRGKKTITCEKPIWKGSGVFTRPHVSSRLDRDSCDVLFPECKFLLNYFCGLTCLVKHWNIETLKHLQWLLLGALGSLGSLSNSEHARSCRMLLSTKR